MRCQLLRYDFDDHRSNEKDSPHDHKNSPHLLRPGHSAHLQSTHLHGSPFFPQPHSDGDGDLIDILNGKKYYQLHSGNVKLENVLIFGVQLQ